MLDNDIQQSNLEKEEKTFGMLCHLLAFVGFLGIPFGNLLGPLVMWIVKKDESDFVDKCGKEAVNFQISMSIYSIICIPFCFVIIGYPALLALFIIGIVCVVKASIRANDGVLYKYPLTIRFL